MRVSLPSSRRSESGKRSDRPALEKALAAARVRQVPLVVAKVDRLTRSVAFLSRLLEAGVDVRFPESSHDSRRNGEVLLPTNGGRCRTLRPDRSRARTKAARRLPSGAA